MGGCVCCRLVQTTGQAPRCCAVRPFVHESDLMPPASHSDGARALSQLARAKCTSEAPVRARGARPGAFRHQPAHALPGLKPRTKMNPRTQRPLCHVGLASRTSPRPSVLPWPCLLSALCPHASLHFAVGLLAFSIDLLASPQPEVHTR